jgi:hypothetical protein
MNEEELERLRSLDWNDLGARLLIFTKYWAKTYYHWSAGPTLPEGKTPEDVAKEAISSFWASVRKWNPKYSVLTQLKGAVRSILSNLHKKKSTQATDVQPPEFFDFHMDPGRDPATEADSNDYCKAIFATLYEQDEVLNSEELMMVVMAYEDDADSIDDVVAKTGLDRKKIYALRRQLKPIKQRVVDILRNKRRE